MKKLLKRPLYLFLSLLLLLIIVSIPTLYIVVYTNSTPEVFDTTSYKISKTTEDFDTSISVTSYTPASVSKDGTKTNGSFRLVVTFGNFKKDVESLRIQFQIASHWIDLDAYPRSYTINSGNRILSSNDEVYNQTCYVTVSDVFPINPFFLVTVNDPTIYVKVSYKTLSPIIGVTDLIDNEVFMKITPSKYYNDIKENTTTTTKQIISNKRRENE